MALSTICGRPVAQARRHEVAGVAILEAGDVKRSNIESFSVERPRQSLDGREVGGEQIGAVEHDRRERPSRHLRHVETMHAMHGERLGGKTMVRREPREMRHEIERAAHVLRTAGGEERIEPREHRAIDGGKLGEPRVVAAVAGEQRQRNALRPRGVSNFLRAIAPIVEAAEQADHHAARARDHLLDIEIDRHRVAELREIGEAERRRALALARTRKRRARRGRCRRRRGRRGRRAIGRDRRRLPPRQVLSSRAPGDAWSSPECRLRWRRGRARARRSPRYGLAARRRSARAGRRSSGSARRRPAPQGAWACRSRARSP